MKNILNQYTARTLQKNKVRTAVTIIGIILSMGLMTAVLEGAYSGIQYLINVEIEHAGSWHGGMRNMTAEKVSELSDMKEVKETACWEEVGWADAGTQNVDKPYLLIESLGKGAEDLIAVRLIQGRLPENEKEILLPEHLESNGGVDWKVGDEITLDVGKRVFRQGAKSAQSIEEQQSTQEEETEQSLQEARSESQEELGVKNPFSSKEEEMIAETVQKTYTVTGTYMRFGMELEPYDCPGYTALTRGGGNGKLTAFYTMKNPMAYYKFANSQTLSSDLLTHSDLLMNYGITGRSNLNLVIYGFAVILIILIILGSVSLIYNSFSISVGERTRQFGILKSVGATGKQIRSSVFYEAFVLSGIAIPIGAVVGCAGIGLTLHLLQNSFGMLISTETGTRIHLVIWIPMLLIAAAICLLTTLISAWIPALRARRIPPIEAIRRSKDVRIKNRSVRTSKLTQVLFGFEGMMASKNFKREKKRYRSVVISLSLSILLFIATSSLTAYLTESAQSAVSSSKAAYDVCWNIYGNTGDKDPEAILSKVRAMKSVEEAAFATSAMVIAPSVPNQLLSPDLFGREMLYEEGEENSGTLLVLSFADDRTFEKMLSERNLDRDAFFDSKEPQAVVYHHMNYAIFDPDSKAMIFRTGQLFRNNAVGTTITGCQGQNKKGLYFDRLETNAEGRVEAVYFELLEGEPEDGEYDPEKEVRFPAESACDVISLKIGALVDGVQDYFIGSTSYVVFQYPYSMMDAVLKNADTLRHRFANDLQIYALAADHRAAAENIRRYMDESELGGTIDDAAEEMEVMRMLIMVINVFSFGFIIIISLIAAANVFNTISTNVTLRRREFAMLKSVGLSDKGFRRMMNYECLIYGLKGLLWGLPASVAATFLIWRVTRNAFEIPFCIPWYSVAIAVGAVFLVVFASMLYAARRVRKDNLIEAIKNENL